MSPRKSFQTLVMDVLVNGLRRSVPVSLRVRREMTIAVDRHDRPEPDVSVVRAEAVPGEGLNETRYLVEDIVLAVEVVSPESVARDRKRRSQLYAEAGW
ncbi:Uma2 family endonuclease [Streptomyces sp. SPB162]|nr:Uma2 family endonuclease [Streptomyces sp. SPB162]